MVKVLKRITTGKDSETPAHEVVEARSSGMVLKRTGEKPTGAESSAPVDEQSTTMTPVSAKVPAVGTASNPTASTTQSPEIPADHPLHARLESLGHEPTEAGLKQAIVNLNVVMGIEDAGYDPQTSGKAIVDAVEAKTSGMLGRHNIPAIKSLIAGEPYVYNFCGEQTMSVDDLRESVAKNLGGSEYMDNLPGVLSVLEDPEAVVSEINSYLALPAAELNESQDPERKQNGLDLSDTQSRVVSPASTNPNPAELNGGGIMAMFSALQSGDMEGLGNMLEGFLKMIEGFISNFQEKHPKLSKIFGVAAEGGAPEAGNDKTAEAETDAKKETPKAGADKSAETAAAPTGKSPASASADAQEAFGSRTSQNDSAVINNPSPQTETARALTAEAQSNGSDITSPANENGLGVDAEHAPEPAALER